MVYYLLICQKEFVKVAFLQYLHRFVIALKYKFKFIPFTRLITDYERYFFPLTNDSQRVSYPCSFVLT